MLWSNQRKESNTPAYSVVLEAYCSGASIFAPRTVGKAEGPELAECGRKKNGGMVQDGQVTPRRVAWFNIVLTFTPPSLHSHQWLLVL